MPDCRRRLAAHLPTLLDLTSLGEDDTPARIRFYAGDPALFEHLRRHRICGIEMETAGLYGLAMREGFRALSILAVSDNLESGAQMPADEREQALARIAPLALACVENARDA